MEQDIEAGTKWEDPLTGTTFVLDKESAFSVTLRKLGSLTAIRTVDKRNFPGRFVPEGGA